MISSIKSPLHSRTTYIDSHAYPCQLRLRHTRMQCIQAIQRDEDIPNFQFDDKSTQYSESLCTICSCIIRSTDWRSARNSWNLTDWSNISRSAASPYNGAFLHSSHTLVQQNISIMIQMVNGASPHPKIRICQLAISTTYYIETLYLTIINIHDLKLHIACWPVTHENPHAARHSPLLLIPSLAFCMLHTTAILHSPHQCFDLIWFASKHFREKFLGIVCCVG